MVTDIFSFVFYFAGKYISLFLQETWWFILLLALIPTTHSTWLYWRQLLYKKSWGTMPLLELRIPREITKNPRGMEQVLRALHTLGNAPGNIGEKYWQGEVPRWFSLELASFGGEVHFYVRCSHKQRGLVEAAFFSYYSDVEILEVKDYMERLPHDVDQLHDNGYEMFAGELLLTKPAAYPLKTYLDFEVPDEDIQLVDPISSFLEILGKIKPDEFVGIQINIAPGPSNWVKEFEPLIAELRDSKSKSVSPDEGFSSFVSKSPGQIKVLKAIEEKLARPIFDTMIRFMYISPKATYFDNFARKGLVGAFSQYGTLDMNGFRQNYQVSTRTQIWNWPHLFPDTRKLMRQKRIYRWFIEREMPEEEWAGELLSSHFFNWNTHSETVRLCTSEIATLFHPPTQVVLTAPHIPRVESRKAGPPSGLPIYSEEGAIDKFL